MREILFRGKRIDTGEWVYGYVAIHTIIGEETELKTVIVQKTDKIYQYNSWIVDPETVGQYTGLKDKNGKKIFEGDVLEGNIANLVVAYEGATFIAYWFDHDYDYGKEKMWCNLVEGGKVIGDVHDNPELVEDK